MKSIDRIGVSLDKKLLAEFDKLIFRKGYNNRSEAIRDLIRQKISSEKISDTKAKATAVVYMVYDHHSTKLMQKITSLQHNRLLQVVSSLHIHLDKHDCMEIIILKGRVSQIRKIGENILSQKGVKLGKINLISNS